MGTSLPAINSDDYYAPGAFAQAAEAFAGDSSLMMIYGNLHIINEKGRHVRCWKQKDFDYLSLLYRRMDISQPGSFLRREVIRLVGELDEELHYVMDLDYWLRLGQVGLIRYVPFAFASYRVHESAKSSSSPELWQEEMLRMLTKFFEQHEHFTEQ